MDFGSSDYDVTDTKSILAHQKTGTKCSNQCTSKKDCPAQSKMRLIKRRFAIQVVKALIKTPTVISPQLMLTHLE